MAAVSPADSSANKLCAAVIPDPQYSTALSVTPWLAAAAASYKAAISADGRNRPSGYAFADDGTLTAPGM